MPFVIVTNTSQLEIKWSDDLNIQPINTQYLQNSYYYIFIQGSNYQQLEYYDILSRTEYFDIKQCTVDLSKIKCNVETICLNTCICYNDFTIDCTTKRFNVVDTQLKYQQLNDLNFASLCVKVSSHTQFDFYNCYNLNCKLNSLTLLNQNIDLQKLKGTWNAIILENCILYGQIDSDVFKINTIQLTVTEQNYLNNFKALESMECNSFHVKTNVQDQYQTINLGKLSNDQKQKKHLYAYLETAISDLTQVTNIWSYIKFSNCIVLCDENTFNTKLSNTQIEMTRNEKYKLLDVSLYQNKVRDLNSFQLCKPKDLSLSQLNINLDELIGTWYAINLNQCTFTNSIVQNPESIKAKSIRISKMEYKLISYFSADSIELSSTTISQTFPNTNRLIINDSTVNVTEPNYSIQHLTLFSAKLIRFSVLSLPSLVSIDMNYILKTSRHYSTKEAIIHYIRQKKKNRNILKQRLNRVVYEQKRIMNVQNRISSLVRSFNSVLCEPIQHSLLINDE
ncbi:Hypothetical_protein [Hexamita inflata]|uniref:Hypothetical_protein n=1 Tax=Hexamita inflata TaxID=28002 RepID=A0AA86PPQ5_9EUKA|nr:Hypothetical protein HINF_LOCUS31534 [Hexamita inflata]